MSCVVSCAAIALPANAQSSSSAELGQSLLYRTAPAGQANGGYGNGGYKQYPKYGEVGFHHLAIEAGAGFDAPVGNTKNVQTFGYNIRGGAGYNVNRHFGLLAEYEFHRSGIPNAVVAANQAPQGNVHIWGFSLDPVVYYKNTGGWGGYFTGGAGFYRKLTSFTQPVFEGNVCDYYYGCYPQYGNQVISHFSSNQAGLNIGTGLTHNIGEGGAKVFAEARYLWLNSPKSTASSVGSGTVNMIPVSFGIRF
jgi:hypothetical protein